VVLELDVTVTAGLAVCEDDTEGAAVTDADADDDAVAEDVSVLGGVFVGVREGDLVIGGVSEGVADTDAVLDAVADAVGVGCTASSAI